MEDKNNGISMGLSHWEKTSFFPKADFWIIGSGIVGLSAAISLLDKNENLRVCVAERGILPSGASTRNAGFACFGSLTELQDDLQHMPENEVWNLVENRWKGLQKLRNRLGDARIGFKQYGGYEIFRKEDEKAFQECQEEMHRINQNLEEVIGEKNIFSQENSLLDTFSFGGAEHLIANRCEGQIDTGMMMKNLIALAREKGVEIFNGIHIDRIESQSEGEHTLITRNGWQLKGKNVILATNGFAKQFLPELEVMPARNQVIITQPIPNLKCKGTFHYDKGYVYFRNVGNRVLLGGARNEDPGGEETDQFGFTETIQQKLFTLMNDMILPGVDWSIESKWSGIMGVGPVKSPIIKEVRPGLWVAVRLGGMGVAMGSLVGEEVAEKALR